MSHRSVIVTDVGEFHPPQSVLNALGSVRIVRGRYDRRYRLAKLGNRYLSKVRAHCIARWAADENGPFTSRVRHVRT